MPRRPPGRNQELDEATELYGGDPLDELADLLGGDSGDSRRDDPRLKRALGRLASAMDTATEAELEDTQIGRIDAEERRRLQSLVEEGSGGVESTFGDVEQFTLSIALEDVRKALDMAGTPLPEPEYEPEDENEHRSYGVDEAPGNPVAMRSTRPRRPPEETQGRSEEHKRRMSSWQDAKPADRNQAQRKPVERKPRPSRADAWTERPPVDLPNSPAFEEQGPTTNDRSGRRFEAKRANPNRGRARRPARPKAPDPKRLPPARTHGSDRTSLFPVDQLPPDPPATDEPSTMVSPLGHGTLAPSNKDEETLIQNENDAPDGSTQIYSRPNAGARPQITPVDSGATNDNSTQIYSRPQTPSRPHAPTAPPDDRMQQLLSGSAQAAPPSDEATALLDPAQIQEALAKSTRSPANAPTSAVSTPAVQQPPAPAPPPAPSAPPAPKAIKAPPPPKNVQAPPPKGQRPQQSAALLSNKENNNENFRPISSVVERTAGRKAEYDPEAGSAFGDTMIASAITLGGIAVLLFVCLIMGLLVFFFAL